MALGTLGGQLGSLNGFPAGAFDAPDLNPPTFTITDVTKSGPSAAAVIEINISAVDAGGNEILLVAKVRGTNRVPRAGEYANSTGDVELIVPAERLLNSETITVAGMTRAANGDISNPRFVEFEFAPAGGDENTLPASLPFELV